MSPLMAGRRLPSIRNHICSSSRCGASVLLIGKALGVSLRAAERIGARISKITFRILNR